MRTVALAAILVGLHGAATAQTDEGQIWRASVFQGLAGGSAVCAAVLHDPADARIDAGIHWAFNSARSGELPDGYLSVHPDLGQAGNSLVVDGGRSITLDTGPDGYLYSPPGSVPAIGGALRRGLAAELRGGSAAPVTFTLIGFTAAADAARRACAGSRA